MEIDLSLYMTFQDQSYQMNIQYIDHSAAIKQSVTGQAELHYILCNVLTSVPTCQALQVPTVPRVSYPSQPYILIANFVHFFKCTVYNFFLTVSLLDTV